MPGPSGREWFADDHAVPDDGTDDKPPLIRRADLIAVALVGLFVLAIIAALYFGRTVIMPVVAGFVVGTMLAPAAKLFERYHIPRGVSAVLIVAAVFGLLVLIVSLISAPVVEWANRLPELGPLLKAKLHVFDRPLALWRQLQASFGDTPAPAGSFQLPTVEWIQPTLEYLSPTITELLLFFAVLILFIASWPDLRRTLVLLSPDRSARLRMLRILNGIEHSLGGYLLTVTVINLTLGAATGLICAIAGLPNPAGLGALTATLNFIPIIGPIVMFVILALVGVVSADTLGAGLIGPSAFAAIAFVEGHFITPAIIGRRLALNALAVFIALAFWSWLWGPMGAFLSSPLLIVALVLKEHLTPVKAHPIPEE